MWAAAANIVRALVWPTVVLVLLLLYQDSVRALVNRLSRRIVGVSVFSVSLQFVPPPPVWPSYVIDGIRVQESVGDSLSQIIQTLSTDRPLVYIRVDLGERWLSSRLFLLAYSLYRVRDLRYVVFVRKVGGVLHYLGLASALDLCRILNERQPWLETAYLDACLSLADARIDEDDARGSEWEGRERRQFFQQQLSSPAANQIAERFKDILQRDPPSEEQADWVRAGDKIEHATVITADALPEMLNNVLHSAAYFVDMPQLSDNERQKQVVLRGRTRNGIGLPYIAAVDENHTFEQFVDRASLVERVARHAVQETL
jgi:hypothetical protein